MYVHHIYIYTKVNLYIDVCKKLKEREWTYRKLDKAEDEDGPEAPEEGVWEVATEEGKDKDGAHKVGDNIGRFRQGEMHFVYYICYKVVPYRGYPHDLKGL